MTGHQAIQILQKPVFGDQRCIHARNILRVIAEIEKAWNDYRDSDEFDGLDWTPDPPLMETEENILFMLWQEAGSEVVA